MPSRKSEIINPLHQKKKTHGFYGYVDELSFAGARGWLINIDHHTDNLIVSAYIAGNPVGDAVCKTYRKDISEIFNLKANSGFELSWDIKKLRQVAMALDDTQKTCTVEIKAQNGLSILCDTKTFDISSLKQWIDAIPIAASSDKHISARQLTEYFSGIDSQIVEPAARTNGVKIIAYYLPQFHPIPENDEWWGPGFTEWTNVTLGKPYFDEHYQPHVPGELGFYDLRLPEVREAQAVLAREHGIYGFCYYYYWFNGRRLLERPLQEVFESGKPDFPFCICWANENWTRRWDGAEADILLQQVHNEETDAAFIRDVIPLFKDKRYIRINGAPLLVIYRLSLLPSPKETAKLWRKICAESGIPNIHLCMVESFGLTNPYDYGFDSSVQFPPHGTYAGQKNSEVKNLAPDFSGNIHSMSDVIGNQMVQNHPVYKRFPGVMTSWDNTSRKKSAGNVFIDSTPENYEMWLRHAIRVAKDTLAPEERYVFVNAWNEWAEGAHLEPDRKYGRAYLESTLRAVSGQSDWRLLAKEAAQGDALTDRAKNDLLHELVQQVKYFDQVNSYLMHFMGTTGLPKHWVRAKQGRPIWLDGLEEATGGILHIDQINHFHDMQENISIDSIQKLFIKGWNIFPGLSMTQTTITYFILCNKDNGDVYQMISSDKYPREDVANNLKTIYKEDFLYSGFTLVADISNMEPGLYTLYSICRVKGNAMRSNSEIEIAIL